MVKSQTIHLFTIGFTQKTAESFFETLKKYQIKMVIDTRLNNSSQLSGFTKKQDLEYFLKTICQIDYSHNLNLAPEHEDLKKFKTKKIDWQTYQQNFINLIRQREIETQINPEHLDHNCLLCSESQPHFCHRRLVAEYLQKHWKNIKITHL